MKARDAMRHHLQSFQRGYNVLFEAGAMTPPNEAAAPATKELRTPKAPAGRKMGVIARIPPQRRNNG